MFNRSHTDRKARRKRKPKIVPTTIHTQRPVLEDIAEESLGLEGGFQTTYQPSRHESGWLRDSLQMFYDQDFITDVLAVVKGGKEASVYRCEAHPTTNMDLLAAKVYRPRMFRNLRNDKLYREGRSVLTETGTSVKENEHRIRRAVGKQSTVGVT